MADLSGMAGGLLGAQTLEMQLLTAHMMGGLVPGMLPVGLPLAMAPGLPAEMHCHALCDCHDLVLVILPHVDCALFLRRLSQHDCQSLFA